VQGLHCFARESSVLWSVAQTKIETAPKCLKNLAQTPSYWVEMTASLARIDVSVGPSREILDGLVQATLECLRQRVPTRVVAVYVEQQVSAPATANVWPETPRPTDGFTLELRFASFLHGSESAGIRTVPTYLLPWLKAERVLVVPLTVEGFQRGAIVVDATKLGRKELDAISELEIELSDKLTEVEQQAPQGLMSERVRFAHSVRRIKTLV